MLIAVTDDDTCFFTNPEDLCVAYCDFPPIRLSLAVIPFAFPRHRDRPFNDRAATHAGGEFPLGDNHDLVEHLRQSNHEITLHGFSHQYKRKSGNVWIAEYVWRSKRELLHLMLNGKIYLEKLLHKKIRVFVAPRNQISRAGIEVIEKSWTGPQWDYIPF